MTDEETLTALGQLAQAAREAKGVNRIVAAEGMGVSYKTIGAFEKNSHGALPAKSSRRGIESYYGWREGVIEDIWNRRRELHQEDLVMDLLVERKDGVLEARHLTDEQLINELTFRLIMKQS